MTTTTTTRPTELQAEPIGLGGRLRLTIALSIEETTLPAGIVGVYRPSGRVLLLGPGQPAVAKAVLSELLDEVGGFALETEAAEVTLADFDELGGYVWRRQADGKVERLVVEDLLAALELAGLDRLIG